MEWGLGVITDSFKCYRRCVWIFLTIAKDGAQKSLVGVYVHDQKSMSQALELQNFEVESYGVYLT